ncbi:citrate synthase [Chitinimonas taiwanensis]|uniref:citrate synthase n=1 Tax=Chitinimonas taiwanensis TaxID=240412 RepID=UPI0035B35486
MQPYLNAEEAAALLGVSKATLYAYVSRGKLQPHQAGAAGRGSLYAREELDALCLQKGRGRKPRDQTPPNPATLVNTALSCIEDGEVYYRGRAASALAESESLEDVARWLWQFDGLDPFARAPVTPHPLWAHALHALQDRSLAERASCLLALAQLSIPGSAWLTQPQAQAEACANLLRYQLAGLLGRPPSEAPLHEQLRDAWHLDAAATELVRGMLVICADNIVNPTCYVARVLASLGAPLGSALQGGMSNVWGIIEGGTPEQVEAQWAHWQAAPDLTAAVASKLEQGDKVFGFYHSMFPHGDGRVRWLLSRIAIPPEAARLMAAMQALTGFLPNVDFALVAVRRALGLPPEAAFVILHVARTVGLLANVLEQRRSGLRLRAGAHYAGPRPQSDTGA